MVGPGGGSDRMRLGNEREGDSQWEEKEGGETGSTSNNRETKREKKRRDANSWCVGDMRENQE